MVLKKIIRDSALLIQKLKGGDAKSITFRKNVMILFLLKFINIGVQLISVPLLIGTLGDKDYGLMITLISIVSWINIFDLGIGNGLRNHLTIALEKGDFRMSKKLVSSAYIGLSILMLCIAIISVIAINFANWNLIFGINEPTNILGKIIGIILTGTLIQFILKLAISITYAEQKAYLGDIFTSVGQLAILGALFTLQYLKMGTLMNVCIIYTFIPVFMFFMLNVYLLRKKEYHLSLNNFDRPIFNKIAGLGWRFFLVQASALIMFATDNYLILRLFSAEDVTLYNIPFRLFSTVSMVWGIILTPFWSMVTKSIAANDYQWVQKNLNTLIKLWMISLPAIAVIILSAPAIYELWLGKKIEKIPFEITIVCALSIALASWNNIHSFILNGTGKIKIQLIIAIVIAILNIPMVILLVKGFNFGIAGVPLAGILCMTIAAIISPIQVQRILKNTARGIWNA